MVVVDGDKPSAEFLKKKIDSITSQNKTKYGEYDIMYSYEIEGDTHEKDSYIYKSSRVNNKAHHKRTFVTLCDKVKNQASRAIISETTAACACSIV